MKVRAIWALLVAVCLLAAGGTRGVQADDGHHATTISATRHGAGVVHRAKVLPHIVALAVDAPQFALAPAVGIERLAPAPVPSTRCPAVLARATSPRGPPVA